MRKIIVIDDDAPIRDVFEIILARAGFDVQIYGDGEAVLANTIREPDLFIIDKQLTGVDGLDIFKFLRAREGIKKTPVIIISASNRAEREALDAGADAFLAKPFKTAILVELVKQLMNITGNSIEKQ
ncbi:MAG: response regulator [Chitinophagaceae bacterium]